MNTLKPILLVDDSEYDVELAIVSLKDVGRIANEIVVARDGVEALGYMFRRGKFKDRAAGNPAVILLDLKMPKLNGFDVLKTIRKDGKLKSVPVVILTSSKEEQDIVSSYDNGANAYVVKPVDNLQFTQAIGQLGLFWAVTNVTPA